MAINLDGSTQYVRVGSAGTPLDIYRTRPFTVAVLIDTTSIGNFSQYSFVQQGAFGACWGLGLDSAQLSFTIDSSTKISGSAIITANTGWWLLAVSVRDSGAATTGEWHAYRYNTSTLSTGTFTTWADADPSAPGSGAETCIGAAHDGVSAYNLFPGWFGWAGVWAGDFSDGGASNPPRIWELIVRGPWGLIDSNCKLFVPMLRSNLMDHGTNRNSIANVGGAGFVGGGPTELPLSGAIVITTDAPAGGITVTPGTASLSLSSFAPTVSVSNNQTATPGTRALTLSTFAPTVTASDHQVVTPGTRALSLSTFAPTVTASNNQTVTPGTVALSLSAFAPTVTTTANQTVTPGTLALTLTAFAPTVTTSGNVTVTPDVRALTLSTFAPTVTASGSVTVTPGMLALTLTAFAPTVTASNHQLVTPGTRALTLSTFAPTVTVTGASGNNNLQPYIVVYFWRRDA